MLTPVRTNAKLIISILFVHHKTSENMDLTFQDMKYRGKIRKPRSQSDKMKSCFNTTLMVQHFSCILTAVENFNMCCELKVTKKSKSESIGPYLAVQHTILANK